MVSRTARRYAKQVLRHMKKIAKASHGRLGVYTLSELMNEGKAKTAFARAVIERAMINGITPAQAAKELLEQRGDARMMAEGGEYYIPIDKREFAVISSNLFERFQDKTKFGVIVRSADNWYFCDYFGEDKNVKARAVFDIEADREFINAFEKAIANETFRSAEDFSRRFESFRDGYRQQNNGRPNVQTRVEGDVDAGVDESELQEGGISNTRTSAEQSRGNLPYETVKSQHDGSSQPRIRFIRTSSDSPRFMTTYHGTSHVQLMEGSDGTVYGWCEIERDAYGNVVARHIYLNDEVLNANTMVHELG